MKIDFVLLVRVKLGLMVVIREIYILNLQFVNILYMIGWMMIFILLYHLLLLRQY